MASTILVSGASGLIGSAVVPALEAAGHTVVRLVRREPRDVTELRWNPAAHLFDRRLLAGFDVVVNLAGESIGRRWTSARRRKIRGSRVDGTDAIVAAIAASSKRPITLINASAVGFYGDGGDDLLRESRGPGRGFLADTCQLWEASANRARQSGARVVTMRTGMVVSKEGGALPRLMLPIRFGVGGKLGNGRQWVSWISRDDAARAVAWLIAHPEITGPVNLTAPNPVTNIQLTKAIGRAMHRPTVIPVPGIALELLFGAMARETLLVSQRAVPAVLERSGFSFQSPTIEMALREIAV
jgi:uncharacterized protein (TIGR01777 family)